MGKKILPPDLESETAKQHWEELTAHNANRKIATEIDKVWEGLPEGVVERLELERNPKLVIPNDPEIAREIDKIGKKLFTKAELRELEEGKSINRRK